VASGPIYILLMDASFALPDDVLIEKKTKKKPRVTDLR